MFLSIKLHIIHVAPRSVWDKLLGRRKKKHSSIGKIVLLLLMKLMWKS